MAPVTKLSRGTAEEQVLQAWKGHVLVATTEDLRRLAGYTGGSLPAINQLALCPIRLAADGTYTPDPKVERPVAAKNRGHANALIGDSPQVFLDAASQRAYERWADGLKFNASTYLQESGDFTTLIEALPCDPPARGAQTDILLPIRWTLALLAKHSTLLKRDGGSAVAAVSASQSTGKPSEKTVEELEAELGQLIGLKAAKTTIRQLIAEAQIAHERKVKDGITSAAVSRHMTFEGNPGTGKTTVAHILGALMKAHGLLRTGNVVYVTRADLVAGVVGATAIKTRAKLEEALGGVFIVDEAYELYKPDEQDFGREALAEIIAVMENNRDDIVLIFAGYTKEMEDFKKGNRGIKSRIAERVQFEDYSADELFQIFDHYIKANRYSLPLEAAEQARFALTEMIANKDEHWGNAREARRFFDACRKVQSARLAGIPASERGRIERATILKEDVIIASSIGSEPGIPYEDAIKAFDNLIGMQTVRDQMAQFAITARADMARRRAGKNVEVPNLHLILQGPPGTAKTTVARLYGTMMRSIGLLPRGHVVEVTREHLVGKYQGHTAARVADVVSSAFGGVLFIDEIDQLIPSEGDDYGREAVNGLMKLVYDNRHRMALVIAGYPESVQKFLATNPGWDRRIPNRITFTDYTPDQLHEIFQVMVRGWRIEPEAVAEAKKVFVQLWERRDPKTFGNGGVVENFVQAATSQTKIRVVENNDPDTAITLEDIQWAAKQMVKQSGLDEAVAVMNAIPGQSQAHAALTKWLNQTRAHVARCQGTGQVPVALLGIAGRHGSGKRTHAKALVEPLRAIGMAQRDILVECRLDDLCAAEAADTEQLVKARLRSAIGGTLYVAIASGLPETARDAFDALAAELDAKRGQVTVIVGGTKEQLEWMFAGTRTLNEAGTMVELVEMGDAHLVEAFVHYLLSEGYKLDGNAMVATTDLLRRYIDEELQPTESIATIPVAIGRLAIEAQNRRLNAYEGEIDETGWQTITEDDIAGGIRLACEVQGIDPTQVAAA